jgi:multiple sugar transport system permease protein
MTVNKKLYKWLMLAFGLVIALPFLYPFWWMLINSLNTAAQIFGAPSLLPKSWRWANYHDVFIYQPYARHYLNSLLVSGAGTAGNILFGALAGYGFSRMKFYGRNTLFVIMLTALMMPVEVTIIALFQMAKGVGLTDSLVPLILLAMFGGQGAFTTFLMRQYFLSLPRELEEAATLDGLGHFATFMKISMPLAAPAIGSAAILSFLSSWNAFLEPLVFVSDINKFTLPLSLSNFTDTYGLPQWHLQLAATSLAVIPILVVYVIFQKKIADAMVFSGLKG